MTKIFSIGRLVVQIGWAKSGTWGVTEGNTHRTYLFSLHMVKRNGVTAVSMIMGPICFMSGIEI